MHFRTVISAANSVADETSSTFGHLTLPQLNWKPSPERWRTEHLDLEKIVITSPAAGVVIYSLMDAYRLIVVHEQRHFQQAKRVTEETGFPA